MSKQWINNREQIFTSTEKKLVLEIAEEGLDAIDTELVMQTQIKLEGNFLKIKNKTFDLKNYKRVLVLGFGKASGKASLALENILGNKITAGVTISLKTVPTKIIKTFAGSHPLPSLENVQVAKKMAELVKDVTADDLVICLVSGGGSSLLCWDEQECEQGTRLYKSFLKTGGDIKILNTVRKHISQAKGGGLAKLLYPATVVGLIFSDVAGDNANFVNSGPTFYDESTVKDAQKIINDFELGNFELNETPKEKEYFANVHNLTLVSNTTALEAMKKKAESLGIPTVIVSSELFEDAEKTLAVLFKAAKPGTMVLGGSEIQLIIKNSVGGKGGRNTYIATAAISKIQESDIFAAVASDGLDNSDCAGAVIDYETVKKVKQAGLDPNYFLNRYDGYSLFEQTGHELIFTGPTEANVSDYLILYKK